MAKHNHAFDIAFEVVTDKENPDDVTKQELIDALLARLNGMLKEDHENGWNDEQSVFLEACSCYDTYEILEEDGD
jgi:hypothetical protein